ncbi:Bacteriophage replication protein O [Paenibacillus sp. P1XP2]|nr:Bacteriophage replication protein O [Paenibacillus sp. P1XP2]
MANPQLEDGFTRVAHRILEEIATRKLNATQFRIIMIIWRYTYGFQRKDHDFALKFLQQTTQLPESTIKRETSALIRAKVLVVTQKETSNTPRKLAFNKNYDEWDIPKSGDFVSDEHDLFSLGGGSDLSPPQEGEGGIRFDPPEVSDLNPQDGVLGYQIRTPYKDIYLLKIFIKDNISMFEQFYEIYPRKIAKAYAKKVWEKLCKDKTFDPVIVIQNTANFAETHKLLKTDKKHIPHPSTYLNQKRYEDYEVVDPEGLLQVAETGSKGGGSALDRLLRKEMEERGSHRRDITDEVHRGGLPELPDGR